MRNHIKVLIIVCCALWLVGCATKEAPTEPKETVNTTVEDVVTLSKEQLQHAELAIGKVSMDTLSSEIGLNGVIDVPPQNMISVSFPLGGYLKSIDLLPGTHVTKGEVVAVMEDQQYIQVQQDYLVAEARNNYLEKEYLRQKSLNQGKASSDKALQMAEAEYSTNSINMQGLRQKLQLMGLQPDRLTQSNMSRSVQIKAPASGYVTKVHVNKGRYISSSDVLFEVVDPSDIHLNLIVFEQDINKLYVGQDIIAWSNEAPQKRYACKIILIGKELDEHKSTEVHCHFTSYDHALVPGMYMRATLLDNQHTAAVLPDEAVVHFEDRDYVFVQTKPGAFQLTEVKVGAIAKGLTEIIDGADLQDKDIVVKNAYTLLMQLKNKAEEE